jgi:hypothetical protein
MLDYAANGVRYWSMERLRQDAAETAALSGADLDTIIHELLGGEGDIEEYWESVERNLSSGRVRLIFLADEIPRSLRRLIEFLNEKMADVEVVGVEIRQFQGAGNQVLVPTVVGMTEAAREKNAVRRGNLNRSELLESCTPPARALYATMLDEAAALGLSLYWGGTSVSIRARMDYRQDGNLNSVVYCYQPDQLNFYLKDLTVDPKDTLELRRRLIEVGGLEESGVHTLRRQVDAVSSDALLAAWKELLGWLEGRAALK